MQWCSVRAEEACGGGKRKVCVRGGGGRRRSAERREEGREGDRERQRPIHH